MSISSLSLINIFNSRINLKCDDFFALILGFGVLLSVGPYFLWGTGYFKFYALFSVFCFVSYLCLNGFKVYGFLGVFLFFLLVFGLNAPHIDSSYLFDSSFFLTLIFVVLNDRIQVKVFDSFYFLFAIALVPAIIVWVLLFVGVELPFEQLAPISASREASGVYYLKYFSSLALSSEIYSSGLGVTYRLAGLYDEPGVVGTLSALLLVANRGQLSSMSSKIIFMGGLLSFSLAFYVLIFMYFILRAPFSLLRVLSISGFFVWLFYGVLNGTALVSRFFFERIKLLYYSPLSADNRSDACFLSAFDDFLDVGPVFFGAGPWAHTYLGCDVSSFLVVVYNYGFVGVVLILIFYVSLFFGAFKFIDFRSIIAIFPFLAVFFLSLYQRPDFIALPTVVIFVGACLSQSNLMGIPKKCVVAKQYK